MPSNPSCPDLIRASTHPPQAEGCKGKDGDGRDKPGHDLDVSHVFESKHRRPYWPGGYCENSVGNFATFMSYCALHNRGAEEWRYAKENLTPVDFV